MYCEMHSIPRKLLIALLFTVISYSQDFRVKSEIDAYEYLIGDHIKLELSAEVPNDYDVVFPNLSDTIAKLEIIEIGKIDTLLQESIKILKREVVLTQFDSGFYQIPKFTFVYDKIGDDAGEFIPKKTNLIDFRVNSIQIDTTKAFVDIKGIREPAFSIWEYQTEILIGLGILILLIIIIFVIRKYLNKPQEEPKNELFNPEIEPHILALGALKKLQSKELWQNNLFKEYYTELTDIIRIYIKRCYSIDALEMLSSEIVEALEATKVESGLVTNLKSIFDNADLAKFAKFSPLADDNIKNLENAIAFVEATKQKSIESMNRNKEAANV